MAVITTSAHPKDLWPGVVAHFGHTYDEHAAEYPMYLDVVSSDKAYEERAQYVGLGLAQVKNQPASISYGDTQQGIVPRLTNVTYALGAIITREAVSDGQYEPIANRLAQALAFSLRQTDENVSANVLNRAFNGSYVMTGGDGVALCANNHPNISGGTYSNIITAADLSETVLEDMLIQIMQATDDQGMKISLMGQKLIVHPSEFFNAHRILDSVLQSNTANNDVNVIKSQGLLPDGIAVCHYLTDEDAFFVKTNLPKGTGLIYQLREDKRFAQDNDFDTENAKMKTAKRFAVGWVDPRGVYGSAGA